MGKNLNESAANFMYAGDAETLKAWCSDRKSWQAEIGFQLLPSRVVSNRSTTSLVRHQQSRRCHEITLFIAFLERLYLEQLS